MASAPPLLLCLCFLILALSRGVIAISLCGGPCLTLYDCDGVLICVGGMCNDDPDVGSHICQNGGTPPSESCLQSGTLVCGGNAYPQYGCSPAVTSATGALLTNNDFSEGGDGSGPSQCDGQYHSNNESVVALSTGWYSRGSRCLQSIRITAQNGMSTVAKVVDECDSRNGCDQEHGYQPPCKNNIVDASDAVWNALGLNIDNGIVNVTWTMA